MTSRAIEAFAASIGHLSAPARRAYLAGAKAALWAAFPNGEDLRRCASDAELLSRTRRAKPSKPSRTRPFLRFLESCQGPAPEEGFAPVRHRVLDTLDRASRFWINPSLTSRRDAALLAALCAAPDRGDPRGWPQSCLVVDESGVRLWDREVPDPALSLALRHWHHWRQRLARPDQRRLYRKPLAWSHSGLLFPGPRGDPLSRVALHNALRRFERAGEGSLTPEKIRRAFLAGAGTRLPPRAPSGG